MTINTVKMGPGTLTLGSGPLAVSGQVRRLLVKWNESVPSKGDPIIVLSDEELEAEEPEATYAAVLEGTFLQDIIAGGVVAWSWANKGTEQAFTFVPNTVLDRAVAGTVVPIPLDVGGDVSRTAPLEAQFSWRIIGDPTLGDATP